MSRVVVAGASGLIGQALVGALRARGTDVVRLVRHPATAADEVGWAPGGMPLPPAVLEGAAAVVCLNGASIGRLPWTARYRSTLLWSRVAPTRTLADAVRALGADAPAFVSASATGFYGSAPGRDLDESSPRGRGFLASLCAVWERTAALAGPDARTALLRTAPVIHPRGVLRPLIALTRAGLGGPLGSGRQVWPWIGLDDEVRAILHVIDNGLTGPVNLTAPRPAAASDIGRAVARRLHRPFAVPAPAWALRAALGRSAADGLLLVDARVRPRRLEETGFSFRHPGVDEAVAAVIPAAPSPASAAASPARSAASPAQRASRRARASHRSD